MRIAPLLPALLLLSALPSCVTTSRSPEVLAREATIAAEPRGDFYIGRRYHVESTRFWGWLRRPGESWEAARLVVMNESRCRTPDRLPENPSDGGPPHGFDHNREYRVTGTYTGRAIYDPNSNLFLPEFLLGSIQLANENPGFLFRPNEQYSTGAITIYPRAGVPQM